MDDRNGFQSMNTTSDLLRLDSMALMVQLNIRVMLEVSLQGCHMTIPAGLQRLLVCGMLLIARWAPYGWDSNTTQILTSCLVQI